MRLVYTSIRRMSTFQSKEALYAAKRELRSSISKQLDLLEPDQVTTQSETCFRIVTSLPEYQNAENISIYLSMPSGELQTTKLVEDAFSKGKKVFIPFTHKAAKPTEGQDPKSIPSVMDMVSLNSIEDFRGLKKNSWGIPTPTKASLETRLNCLDELKEGRKGLDLVVVPGVAFDDGRRRLGHGKGYYDYFFKKYSEISSGKMPSLVAVALKEQILKSPEAVPVDETDWTLDKVVVCDGVIIRKEDS